MTRRLIVALVALVAVAAVARGDKLKLRLGEELRGSVQLVTFTVNDRQSIYPREEVVGIQVATDGKDVLETRLDPKVEGKLVSVMFDAPGGLRAVTRDKIETMAIDDATTVDKLRTEEKQEAEKKEEEQQKDVTDEQKEALIKNRDLYKEYNAKVDDLKKEGLDGVKTKHMGRLRDAYNEVGRLQRSIQDKLRRREEASSRTYSTSDGRTQQMSERERLMRNDGLAADERAIEKAVASGNKLKSTIRDEQKVARDRAEQRSTRVGLAYAANRKRILGGEALTEEDMRARYDAAVTLPGDKPVKAAKAAGGGAATKTADTSKTPKVKQGLGDVKGE